MKARRMGYFEPIIADQRSPGSGRKSPFGETFWPRLLTQIDDGLTEDDAFDLIGANRFESKSSFKQALRNQRKRLRPESLVAAPRGRRSAMNDSQWEDVLAHLVSGMTHKEAYLRFGQPAGFRNPVSFRRSIQHQREKLRAPA